MIDLKRTEKCFLECLNEATTAEKEKRGKCIYEYPSGLYFPINKDIEEYKMRILSEIAKNEPVKTNLSEKYLKTEVEKILFKVYSFPEAQRQDILNKELISFGERVKIKLEDEIKDYTVTLHINRLQIEENLNVGEVNFYKLDEKKADEINADEIENQHSFIQHITGGKTKFLKMGDVYAEVNARGVQDYAYSLSLYKVRLTINVIKLFLDPDYCIFGLDGEIVPRIYRNSFLSYEDSGPLIRKEPVGGAPDYFLSKKTLEFMNEHGFDELNKILKKGSDISDYDNRLLTGIYWFGEAVSVITPKMSVGSGLRTNEIENFEFFNNGEKLLKLFTALESVLIFNDNEQITRNIAERAAMILIDDYDERINIRRSIVRIYDNRSKLVHHGLTYVKEEDLSWLTGCVRGVLFKLIELKKEYKFKSPKDLCKHIERLILS